MTSSFLPSKLPRVGTTIFTTMSALANKYDAINLSQGFPDFDCDPILTEMVTAAMREGKNQYAPMQGLLALREEIAILSRELYQSDYSPADEITITSGASEALFAAVNAVVSPGDEVIIIEPAYDLYVPAITLAGGVPVCYSASPPDYAIDWDQIRKLVSPRTRAIMLNSPQNPTGKILLEEDIDALVNLVSDTPMIVISDEVYEHIIFDGQKHLSIAGVPELKHRSFVISSFGKSLHTTGWKVGFCLAPPDLTRELRKVHQFITFSTSTPFQYGITAYLKEQKKKVLDLKKFYQQRRDYFLAAMGDTPFIPLPASGTYFQLMDYSAISSEPDAVFSERLTRDFGVACIPVSVFYQQNNDHRVVRFCFAKQESTLHAAAERLRVLG